MVSDRIYELCRPTLEDGEMLEEEKIEKLEDLLSGEPHSLKGKDLENTVLGALWQWKAASDKTSSPPPVRGIEIARSSSPASWLQRSAIARSTTASPRPSSATPFAPPGLLARTKSSQQSPFASPRASPRLPVATPTIPHSSPRLSAYIPNGSSPVTTEHYGDYGSDTVDWLVNDDTSSNTSFGDAGFAAGSDFMAPFTTEMSPYDMLRMILQEDKSDEELEQLLEANNYDLGQTVNSVMELQGAHSTPGSSAPEQTRTYLVGKSMAPSSRPVTPAGQQKTSIPCRYWLTTGHCARADCRFAHDVQNHICKFWLQGNCFSGNNCMFSHDPATLMTALSIANSGSNTPQSFVPNLQLQDYDSFPALAPTTSNPYEELTGNVDPSMLAMALQQQQNALQQTGFHQPPGLFPSFVPTGPRLGSGPNSRPGSRHASRAPTPAQPNFQDDEAFPTLGSAASKPTSKRHHGRRGGHNHHNAPVASSSLADVVKMNPSPAPSAREAMRRGLHNNRSFTSTRENSAAAMKIPQPVDIPWLETGASVNTAYLKARQEAFRHGSLRNKFLQSAAQAWNRNDARGAKTLSLRGQNENSLMREKHREAAQALYEERNKSSSSRELYVDLHGLHPEEAVEYLSKCLREQRGKGRPVYAICGTGHHSKNGKDKVGKAVRSYLQECKYVWREFSVMGDRGGQGGILGIDPASGVGDGEDSGVGGLGDSGVVSAGGGDTKVVVVKEDPRKAVQVAI